MHDISTHLRSFVITIRFHSCVMDCICCGSMHILLNVSDRRLTCPSRSTLKKARCKVDALIRRRSSSCQLCNTPTRASQLRLELRTFTRWGNTHSGFSLYTNQRTSAFSIRNRRRPIPPSDQSKHLNLNNSFEG